MEKNDIIAKAREILESMLYESGAILYSSWDTMQPGKFYVLGLNPGGTKGPTIKACLDELIHYNKNAYLDQNWSTENKKYSTGRHPLQINLKALFDFLGHNLREICCSNLIFSRSAGESGADYPDKADICWKIHKMILNIINPDVLLVFGNGPISPYNYLKGKHFKNFSKFPTEKNASSDHGNWLCKKFKTQIAGKDRTVIGLPHLSRYRVDTKPKVLEWVKKIVNE